jgi:ribosomal protein L20A (L18A)
MGFSYGRAYRNSGIKMLHTYKEAKEWHDRTKPIKAITKKDGTTNANAGKRPLGHRNRAWFEIKMGEGESVVCSAYQDEVYVKFTKDGEIHIKNSRYISSTSSHFFEDVLGSGWWAGISFLVHDHAIKVEVRRLDGELETHRLDAEDVMKLRLHENDKENPNRWEVLTPKLTQTHTIDRQAIKEVRGMYEKVYDFARQYCKLLGGDVTVTRQEFQSLDDEFGRFKLRGGWYSGMADFVSAARSLSTLMKGNEDREKEVDGFINVIKVITQCNGTYSWMGASHTASFEQIKEGLDLLLLGLHRDEVLEAKVDDTGRRRDRYGFLYRRGWDLYHRTA